MTCVELFTCVCQLALAVFALPFEQQNRSFFSSMHGAYLYVSLGHGVQEAVATQAWRGVKYQKCV